MAESTESWHFIFLFLLGIGLLTGTFLLTAAFSGLSTGPSGAFVASKYADRILLTEDRQIRSDLTKLVETEGILKSTFGEESQGVTAPFKIARPTAYTNGVLELMINDRQGGPIAFYLNEVEIFRGSPTKGYHWIEFDRELLLRGNVLDGKAAGGLNPFDATEYNIEAKLSGAVIKKFNTTFPDSNEKYKKAILQVYWKGMYGKIIIKVNDQVVYNDEPKDNLNIRLDDLKKKNTIEFLPEPGSKNWIDLAQVVFEK